MCESLDDGGNFGIAVSYLHPLTKDAKTTDILAGAAIGNLWPEYEWMLPPEARFQ